MTFSLIGRCAGTGQFGAAVATSSIAVGARVPFAMAGVGAMLTQHRTDPRLGSRGLALLRSSCTAQQTADALVASTPPRHTAFDSIAHPLRRLEHLRDGATLQARVRDAASRAGLPEELLERFPHQVSGGQKARVGIARAIAPRPRLLILDEPTAALDVSVQAVILQLLDRLRREDGIGLLFVSHDLNVVRMLCDDLVVLEAGRVVEAGPSQAVFANPQASYTRTLLDAIPYFDPQRRTAQGAQVKALTG